MSVVRDAVERERERGGGGKSNKWVGALYLLSLIDTGPAP